MVLVIITRLLKFEVAKIAFCFRSYGIREVRKTACLEAVCYKRPFKKPYMRKYKKKHSVDACVGSTEALNPLSSDLRAGAGRLVRIRSAVRIDVEEPARAGAVRFRATSSFRRSGVTGAAHSQSS